MMYARAWVPLLIFFCPFVLAVPTTTESSSIDVQLQDAAISPLSPIFDAPIIPARRATRFVQRPPVSLSHHVNKALLTTRRRLEFLFHKVAATVLPEGQPIQEDFIFLRSLEDPLFMSANELLLMLEKSVGMVEKVSEQTVQKPPNVTRELLNFLEKELDARSVRNGKCLAVDLRDIVQRMPRSEDVL